ncbi:MAG TPA: hypothetical protein VJH65_03285 [Candidatus Nanoarchaeia archaeon]|nr:hypothetical protein [Candidatus Nanoarchaeia archaeon]
MPDKNFLSIKAKKGQVSEIVTWFAATAIIIIFLLISVYITSSLGIFKGDFGSLEAGQTYIPAEKSFYAYLSTPLSKEGEIENKIIYKILQEQTIKKPAVFNLKGAEADLADKIFNNFYKTNFSKIWIGFVDITAISNTPFGEALKETASLNFQCSSKSILLNPQNKINFRMDFCEV